MNVAAHQEKENEKTGKRESGEEEKNSRLILEKLSAAFVQRGRRQHGEKK